AGGEKRPEGAGELHAKLLLEAGDLLLGSGAGDLAVVLFDESGVVHGLRKCPSKGRWSCFIEPLRRPHNSGGYWTPVGNQDRPPRRRWNSQLVLIFRYSIPVSFAACMARFMRSVTIQRFRSFSG